MAHLQSDAFCLMFFEIHLTLVSRHFKMLLTIY
jgi:hypothetical protein